MSSGSWWVWSGLLLHGGGLGGGGGVIWRRRRSSELCSPVLLLFPRLPLPVAGRMMPRSPHIDLQVPHEGNRRSDKLIPLVSRVPEVPEGQYKLTHPHCPQLFQFLPCYLVRPRLVCRRACVGVLPGRHGDSVGLGGHGGIST